MGTLINKFYEIKSQYIKKWVQEDFKRINSAENKKNAYKFFSKQRNLEFNRDELFKPYNLNNFIQTLLQLFEDYIGIWDNEGEIFEKIRKEMSDFGKDRPQLDEVVKNFIELKYINQIEILAKYSAYIEYGFKMQDLFSEKKGGIKIELTEEALSEFHTFLIPKRIYQNDISELYNLLWYSRTKNPITWRSSIKELIEFTIECQKYKIIKLIEGEDIYDFIIN